MFSTIYDKSFEFLGFATQGLTKLFEMLFTSFKQLGINNGLIDPDKVYAEFIEKALSYNVFTLTIGAGLVFFVAFTIVKFFTDLLG